MFDVPIALMVFNRPEMARGLVDSLRVIRPSRLFVIADGPRPDRAGEAKLVSRTRQAVEQIDWPCQITRVFAKENLGCGLRIRSGISAALGEVDRLIVLEDDCRPNPSFFRYTAELLQRFETESRVMAISGTCFHQQVPSGQSYYFSRYAHCWGWATWRRAWELSDLSGCDWNQLRSSRVFADLFDTPHQMAYWRCLLDQIAQGKLDTWDVQWMLACWLNGGLAVTPTKNLVSNVGFGESATHTIDDPQLSSLLTYGLGELNHPQVISRDVAADAESDRLLFSGTWRKPGMLKSLIDQLRRRCRNCRSIDPGMQPGRARPKATGESGRTIAA
ncbi:MAG: glycosyltransferase family 2 protein [Pirellulales bacterium]|nr:glycosyltransferase family 2 protein [Pirellulales bacterium]